MLQESSLEDIELLVVENETKQDEKLTNGSNEESITIVPTETATQASTNTDPDTHTDIHNNTNTTSWKPPELSRKQTIVGIVGAASLLLALGVVVVVATSGRQWKGKNDIPPLIVPSNTSQYDGGYSNTGGSNGGYRGNGGTSKQNVAYFYVYRNVNSLIQSFYDADAPTLASCRNLCYHDDQCTHFSWEGGLDDRAKHCYLKSEHPVLSRGPGIYLGVKVYKNDTVAAAT